MSTDRIGNTSERLGMVEAASAMMIDGKIVTRDDYRALQAQVEVLKEAIDRYFALDDSQLLLNAYDATPSACLAEVLAEAGKDGFIAGWKRRTAAGAKRNFSDDEVARLASLYEVYVKGVNLIRQGGTS